MTTGFSGLNLIRRFAVLSALVIDGALFIAPRSQRYVFWVAEASIYMFRVTYYECDLFGGGNRVLPWLPFFGHATGDMFWFPQWYCDRFDPMRWGLFVQLVAVGVCYVLGLPREKHAELGYAFAALQTLATATLVLTCIGDQLKFALAPLMLAVGLWRAPPAGRRTLIVSAALVLALEVACLLAEPPPNGWSWALLPFLLAPRGLLLLQLAGTVWLICAPTKGFDVRRVAYPVTLAAVAMAALVGVLRWIAWPFLDDSWDPWMMLWVGTGLLLAAAPAISCCATQRNGLL